MIIPVLNKGKILNYLVFGKSPKFAHPSREISRILTATKCNTNLEQQNFPSSFTKRNAENKSKIHMSFIEKNRMCRSNYTNERKHLHDKTVAKHSTYISS